MRILKNSCMLLPKALKMKMKMKMRAIKDTMALVADNLSILPGTNSTKMATCANAVAPEASPSCPAQSAKD